MISKTEINHTSRENTKTEVINEVINEEYRYMPGYGWVTLSDFMSMRD